MIKSRYKADIRQQVLDKLLPRFFNEAAKKENLEPVGQPSVTDLHFHEGEPLTFTIEFEVPPKIDLKSYTDLTVEFAEPEIADADIDQRVNALRERKAEFVNEDPRPLREGDFAAIKLKSLSGVQPPMESNDLSVEIGGKETLPAFNETLLGLSPDDEREFEVTYPDDYGSEQLAGKAVRFWMQVLSVTTRNCRI